MNDLVKKVLVYDTNKAIFNYLKKSFLEFQFVYHSEKGIEDVIDFIVFIEQRSIDCIEFLNVRPPHIPVIFSLRNKKYISSLDQEDMLRNVEFVDMLETKERFTSEINSVLQRLSA